MSGGPGGGTRGASGTSVREDMAGRFEVHARGEDELALVGELDVAGAERFDRAVAALPARNQVVLDLSELTFIDSTGLRSLLTAARDLDERMLVLTRPTPRVLEVLEIAGVLRRQGNLVIREG